MTEQAKTILKDLIIKLDAGTYAKMCNDREDREELEKIKNTLSSELLLPASDQAPGRELVISFLKACKLQAHYGKSVGLGDEILTTTEIETLPQFIVGHNPKLAEIDTLAEHWKLSEHDVREVEQSVGQSLEQLDRRRAAVDWLRSLVMDSSGAIDKKKPFELFSQLFCGHPLRNDQVDLIATRTALYWLIPKKSDDPAQSEWLKYYERFSFNRFIHFPMFSGFEIRDAAAGFIDTAMEALGLGFHDTVAMLNGSIAIQRKEDVEKYIIHDTWGHVWQADLTGFRNLYDEMESMRRPMEASTKVTYPCGDVVCLADLYFPTKEKIIIIRDEDAVDFVMSWLDQHSDSILAPLIAEMTADIVEYKFVLDNPELEQKMPSSSVFKNDPAKFDFAWVDSSYFCRELRKIHRQHFKDPFYQESFNERLTLLLKDRYKSRFVGWEEGEIAEAVSKATATLLEKFEAIQDVELSNKSEFIEHGNLFFTKLNALLHVQSAVNRFIDTELSCGEKSREGYFELLVLFVGIAFCDWKQNPAHLDFAKWADAFSRQVNPMLEARSSI